MDEAVEKPEDSETITPPKPKKKKKWYTQNFREEWMDEPDFAAWLQPDENDRTCSYCASCKVSLKHANRSMLVAHLNTNKHKKYFENGKGGKDKIKVEMLIKRKKLSEDENKNRAALLLAGFFTEHRLPYHHVEDLLQVLQKAFHKSNIARKTELSTARLACLIQDGIAYHGKLEISDICQKQKFSLMINVNSNNDPSSTLLTAVAVRFFDTNREALVDVLFDTVTPDTDSTESLYNAVKLLFVSKNIPLQNIIGFGCNNALKTGFLSLLRQDLPTVFAVECDTNTMLACYNYAVKFLSSDVEQNLNEISSCFTHRGKSMIDYGIDPEIVKTLQDKLLQQAQLLKDEFLITIILDHWQTILVYFQSEIKHEKDPMNALYNFLARSGTKHMLTFLQFILQKLNAFGVEFHSNDFSLHLLHMLITSTYREILSCFILEEVLLKYKLSDIDPMDMSMHRDEIFLGEPLGILIQQEPLANDSQQFNTSCLQFLIELSAQMRTHLPISDHSILASLDILNPSMVQSQRKGPPSIAKLALHFPNLVPESKLNELDDQWRAFRISKDLYFTDMSIPQFWYLLRNIKDATGKSKFALLSEFMTNLSVLPHYSEAVEKIFSHINNIKTKYKSVLKAESAKDRLIARQMLVRTGKTCSAWEPSRDLIQDAVTEACARRNETRLELYKAMSGALKEENVDIDMSDESDAEHS